MSKKQSTRKELFKALVKHIGPAAETPAEGFYTLAEWMVESGVGREQTTRNLRKGIEAGVVEMKRYRVRCGDKIYPTPHYKVNV